MALHRYGIDMRDREVVAAIVAGDPAGLAEAYDRYATPLYSFCRTMLREPADAADAVQDTFVIAAPRMAGLRDPERLRSWLYAVARNECYRRLRAGSQHASIEEAPDVTDEAADVAADVERADLRALVRDALGGVGPTERDVLELQLRQGLSGGEVAERARDLPQPRARTAVPGPRPAGDLARGARRGPDRAAGLPGAGRDAPGLGRRADRAHAQAPQPARGAVRRLLRTAAPGGIAGHAPRDRSDRGAAAAGGRPAGWFP